MIESAATFYIWEKIIGIGLSAVVLIILGIVCLVHWIKEKRK